jgi:hypothetical protein
MPMPIETSPLDRPPVQPPTDVMPVQGLLPSSAPTPAEGGGRSSAMAQGLIVDKLLRTQMDLSPELADLIRQFLPAYRAALSQSLPGNAISSPSPVQMPQMQQQGAPTLQAPPQGGASPIGQGA